jgi:hypothetical protein
VKSRVAKRNVAFKIKDVLELAKWSLSQVTPEQWAGCVRHAIKEEDRYAEVLFKQELKLSTNICPWQKPFLSTLNIC